MGQNLGDIENFDDAGLQLTDEEENNGDFFFVPFVFCINFQLDVFTKKNL